MDHANPYLLSKMHIEMGCLTDYAHRFESLDNTILQARGTAADDQFSAGFRRASKCTKEKQVYEN